ncbi:hypothetical protein [Burkholderia stabilis]|uniref:Uncharacterized protein n=1 Tax=Burkholderia stabilis TaxID=95485 RepID=A0AAJ5T4J4_9BURK|nr:hypothetical protein [Burkholderia stabilis]VBB12541.1 hypothetical protein BSTAB16_2707 [Burkholderia stabilis]
MSFARNALAIVLFAIAGLCVIAAQMVVFVKVGHEAVMVVYVGMQFALSAVFLVAGAFAGAFRPRARSAGIALLAATAVTALGMTGMASVALSPGIVGVLEQQGVHVGIRMFRFAPGITVMAVSALVGMWLVRRG